VDKYPDYSEVLKKFDGNSVEYKKDEYTYKVEVVKAGDGKITSVSFGKESDMGGGSIQFELTENGVMVSTSSGS
jgi:hypothetical protein